ncbi:PREDICTED: phosphatidylinositol 3,4,5-trisphosphate 3-phosphatase and protein-tyrosine-phosphatase PTEN2A isoform X1 [Theobroma cacao]|uniref:Phosphatidylinositol 3,4,5-trisphosphate 3-phosphatase and protein-tyrosine-phosphatase PTEN2A isoform X1 n=2 Tax=Theobroma cacao TaxID=3641 RepID=A0AB32W6F6_THECC|nr:PREDICTED: phosphatidylinositol 3,4,5-trisphosphate 3-phosphatase and protein-tyrosine-phosphatase PTEN2A isoform X1 [Theobroma cacao]XP_017974992.1 PREDICTED: phosphatidylinositol 3,4,5-trisphosphate 3-phosphatase and protein-tyrosine-phosphatase PTEN2A isoform X1 [Theobroma cacao]XP_017974996.1 PREDICTED: phosphatidylinositol 3,4,5-trisphosphate 3-phosphatase and protein-tyrosine-phosphatase PTEN2A isoform X1 [Theobroma cacao]
MNSESADSSSQPLAKASDGETPAEATDVKPPANTSDAKHQAKANEVEPPARAVDVEPPKASDNPPTVTAKTNSSYDSPPSVLSSTAISSWARNLKFPQPVAPSQGSQAGNAGTSAFARFTSGLGLRLQSMSLPPDDSAEHTSTATQAVLESFKKGIVDSSRSAVKAVQVKARHIVSQNKRRYQEGEFDLDMTYITENIIAMGFPAGDLSSGLFGFFEGFYRNHMEEVIKFFETHHKGRYKVYNLCSERLYDASLFQGKVASFPFDDHNCPQLQLIKSFCQSAYSWLKEDIENVVVVHCKAGMGRTGLMICSLLLFLKFFPTAEEAIDYFNQKRCIDGKALVLPSQIRYVKYFECILRHFNGENQPGHRCMLRGFRLHKCPYWIRPSITISNHNGTLFSTRKHPKTKDLMPEDFWIKAPKKGIVVFALPGQPGLTELVGDFKIQFHDRQGDFYCWLNTTMIENRTILDTSDLDGFDKITVPYPGFKVELVMVDYDGIPQSNSNTNSVNEETQGNSSYTKDGVTARSKHSKVSGNEDNGDVFSDSDGEESGASRSRQTQAAGAGPAVSSHLTNPAAEQIGTSTHGTHQLSVKNQERALSNASKDVSINGVGKPCSGLEIPNLDSMGASDIKVIAADASVFSFGDEEEDYESE